MGTGLSAGNPVKTPPNALLSRSLDCHPSSTNTGKVGYIFWSGILPCYEARRFSGRSGQHK
jgi:hypothetical protein